jgi:DUF4097 and DUF4098 domain-containing protein YvlB
VSDRHELPVDGIVDLDVALDAGRLLVTATAAVDRVIVLIDSRSGDWAVTQVGRSISVRPNRKWKSSSTRVHVEIPLGSRVTAKTASADIRLEGRFGEVEAKTASGDLSIDAIDSFELSTASGDLDAEKIAGDARISTMSGDARIGEIGGRATITTAAGDIRVDRLGGDLSVSTTAGDVHVERFDGSDVTFKAVSGDLDIGIPSGTRVRPDISTITGSTRRPSPTAPSSEPPSRIISLAFKSVSGDLIVRRV